MSKKKPALGRPPADDPLVHLPFRIKRSLAEKAWRLGRERLERWLKNAKEK